MTQIETWIIIIAAMTVAVGFFSGALLLMRTSVRTDQDAFLAAFLVLYGLLKLDQLYLHSSGYEVWPHLAGIMFAAKLLLPSGMYFYVRSLTSPSVEWFQAKDVLAFISPGIAVIIASPYYLLSAEQKIALMDPLTRDPELYQRAILDCQIGLALFVVTALIYLFMSFKRFKEHTSRLRMLFSRIEDKEINWLRWVLLVLALGWTGYALSELWLLTGTQPREAYLMTMVLELLWIGFIALQGINQSPVYDKQPVNLELVSIGTASAKNHLYSRSGLTQADRENIAMQLKQTMEMAQLYKDPELSLRSLSEQLNVSEINLSETFSQHLNTNFFDFINQNRVKEACKLLSETDAKVLAVAYDSGFNSRSTFSAAFKKHIGITPSQYRKEKQQPALDPKIL